MVSKLSAVLSLAIVLAGAGVASAQQQPTGSWAAEAGGDYFYYGSSCNDGTYMYITGGYQGVGSTTPEYYSRFRRYDPANNTWTNMPRIAAGTSTGSAVWGYQYPAPAAFHSYNGTNRIFIFGGYGLNGTIGSTGYSAQIQNAIRMFTFTSATDGTWTTLTTASLSATTYYNACAVLNDKIYVMGGATTNILNIFDPTTLTIASGTAMPGYLYYHGAVGVPAMNKVYVMGGYGTAGYTGINYEYTPQDNDNSTSDVGGTWTTRAQISNGSTVAPLYLGVKCITLGNRVYVIGASTQGGTNNQTYEYNPIANTWVQRASMANARTYWPAFEAINGKGYVYGGNASPFTGEEFTPPSFGSPPNVPTNLGQIGARPSTAQQAVADLNQFEGWTNNQITFTGNFTDPDATQQVRFRVQVKPQSASWTSTSALTNLDTGLTAQGTLALNYTIPAGGGYDWRWRVEDTFANSYPTGINTWVEAFANTSSPDFRSDQIAPADPVAIYPSNVDIQVEDPLQGAVVLNWIESTDNGPVDGISYELQVAHDGGFQSIEAQIFSTAGTSNYPTTLSVARDPKHWRLRAQDIGGNFSPWSPPLSFRVTHNDGANHGAGDAKKSCGFAAAAAPGLWSAVLGIALIGLAAGGRRVRK